MPAHPPLPILLACMAGALAIAAGATEVPQAPGLIAELAPVSRESPRYLQPGQKPQHRAVLRGAQLDLAGDRFAGLPAKEWFALRLRGSLVLPAAGTWTFALISDDSARLTIGGRIVVDNPGLHGPIQARGTATLAAGAHDVQIDYVQGDGGAVLWLGWALGDAAVEPVPLKACVHRPEPGIEATGGSLVDAMHWERRVAQAGAAFAEDELARRREQLRLGDEAQRIAAEIQDLRQRLAAAERAAQADYERALKGDAQLIELQKRADATRQQAERVARQLAEVGR